MRTKYKTKAAALAGLSWKEKSQRAYFGEDKGKSRYDSEASSVMQLVDQAFENEATPLKDFYQKKALSRLWKYFSKHWREARKKSDGSFLHNLANLIDCIDHPVDPVRSLIAAIVLRRQKSGEPLPTQSEFVKIIEFAKMPTTRQSVHRILKEFKIVPPKGQSGRPRKLA